jgi:hypothetical protein
VHPDCGPGFVPGDVYTDLWRVGRIDDPHVGRNGQRAKWVMDYEWWYFKTFKVPPEMKGKQIRLMFEGVDYECDVWLNGEALGNHQGAYSRFHFDYRQGEFQHRPRSDREQPAGRSAGPAAADVRARLRPQVPLAWGLRKQRHTFRDLAPRASRGNRPGEHRGYLCSVGAAAGSRRRPERASHAAQQIQRSS